MSERNDKKIQSDEFKNNEKLAYEKPIVNSISTQIEVNGVVSNCSMGQNIASCSDSEES